MASFHEFAELCQSLSQTGSRLQMAAMAGEFLGGLEPDEAGLAARFMVGRALAPGEEKKLHVSGRAIWKTVAALTGGEEQGEEIFAAAVDFGEAIEMLLRLRPAEPEPALTIGEVAAKFTAIAAIDGRNSRARKLKELGELFARATALEGKYLAKILTREMRHGLSEGLMLEAVARMANRSAAEVRRMHMLEGDLERVVRAIRAGPTADAGAEAGTGDGREMAAPAAPVVERARELRPIKPMLAQPADGVADAFSILGPELALEHKLDGARVQIHRADGQVRIFSRRMNDISRSLPEIAEQVRAGCGRDAIFDGEVIAVDTEGRPLAFQDLMRRLSRRREVERARAMFPVQLYLFDLLALDGELWLDRPYAERAEALSEVAAAAGLKLVGRTLPATLAEGEKFFSAAVEAGYEGVVAKSLSSRYTPGIRGRGWLKIKRAHTLDLVIVAADWGYGKRKGWLSNYYLAARDEKGGGFTEVGKTYKGLTDDEFQAMTDHLLGLKLEDAHGTVTVRPEVVVEVAYSDIQRSPQYPAGMALRFARIVAIRYDKRPEEADTISTVARQFEGQALRPATQSRGGSPAEKG